MHLGQAFHRIRQHDQPSKKTHKIRNGLVGGKNHNDQEPQTQRADHLDHRVDQFAGLGFFYLQMNQLQTFLAVAAHLDVFQAVGFDQADSGKSLNQPTSLGNAHFQSFPGKPLKSVANDEDGNDNQRKNYQGGQGQLCVNDEHPGKDAEKSKRFLDQVGQPVVHGIEDSAGVTGNMCPQVSQGRFIKVIQG